MDLVTDGDRAIWLAYATAVIGIFGLVLAGFVCAWRDRRAHAAMNPAQDAMRDRFGVDQLQGRFTAPSNAPVSHRARWQLPDWLRTLAAYGRAKEPKEYGPPPPLTVVEEPTVSAWPTSDVNTVRWPSNPVRNPTPVPAASDPLDAALTVGRVLADPSLRDLVRQPTSMEATQQIEPVRAEVVQ